jgi:hypothetical protein
MANKKLEQTQEAEESEIICLVENTMLVNMSAHITVKTSMKKNNNHYIYIFFFAMFYVNLRNSNLSNETVPLLRK